MKKTNIGISDKNRQAIADQLSKILADEFLLYSKTLNAHWNIEGPDFHAAHLYLETLYNQQQGIVDAVPKKYVPSDIMHLGNLVSILSLPIFLKKVWMTTTAKLFSRNYWKTTRVLLFF